MAQRGAGRPGGTRPGPAASRKDRGAAAAALQRGRWGRKDPKSTARRAAASRSRAAASPRHRIAGLPSGLGREGGTARIGLDRLGSGWHGSAQLGTAQLGWARHGSDRLGSARLGSGTARLSTAQHGWARLGTARMQRRGSSVQARAAPSPAFRFALFICLQGARTFGVWLPVPSAPSYQPILPCPLLSEAGQPPRIGFLFIVRYIYVPHYKLKIDFCFSDIHFSSYLPQLHHTYIGNSSTDLVDCTE